MSTTGQSLLRQVDLKSLSFGSMAINAAGTWIAISSGYTGPDALMIYDIETGIAHAVPHPPSTEFETPQFTMDDRYLLVFGRPLTYIIDTNSWQTIGTISQNLTITAAPNYVISRPTDRMFAVYTLTNGAPVERHRFPDPYDISSEFTLSPDGQYLAVMDYTFGIPVPLIGTNPEPAAVHIALVRVADGAVVQRFEGPKGYMSNPTFTPDGQQIMTIGPGDGITFWQVALRTPWNVGLRLLPALLGLLLLLEQVRRFIVRGMRRPT
jgi:WD40 repeat protein